MNQTNKKQKLKVAKFIKRTRQILEVQNKTRRVKFTGKVSDEDIKEIIFQMD